MSQSQRSDSRSQHEEQLPHPSAAVTMFLMVGLPGSGKTTRAKELAAAHRALRLTPDHWMIPLFGDSMADGKRFVLEGRLISVALQALRLGISVVLDFGLWGHDERSALSWLARSAGAACQGTRTSNSPGSRTARRRGLSDNRTTIGVKEPRGAVLAPLAVPCQ